MAWGPLCGEHQEFHDICVQDGIVTPKINAWGSTSISHPCVVSLQSPEQREVGLKKSWSVMSFKPHQCNQYLCLWNADVDVHTPLILLHQTFHPLSNEETLETSEWMHIIYYSPILEESHLSDAGPAMDNSHFVVLSQSHSSSEFVPLGWWSTWPV